jgi:hypothetical protein
MRKKEMKEEKGGGADKHRASMGGQAQSIYKMKLCAKTSNMEIANTE